MQNYRLWLLEQTVYQQQQLLQDQQPQLQQLWLLFQQQQLQTQQTYERFQQQLQRAFSLFGTAFAQARAAFTDAEPVGSVSLGDKITDALVEQTNQAIIHYTEEERIFLLRHGRAREAGIEKEFVGGVEKMIDDMRDPSGY